MVNGMNGGDGAWQQAGVTAKGVTFMNINPNDVPGPAICLEELRKKRLANFH